MTRISGIRPEGLHGEEAAWFAGCQEEELLLQRCDGCNAFVFYPRAVCPHCSSRSLTWVQAGGQGEIHTFTIQHRALPGMDDAVPAVIAMIELDEGVRMLSRVLCPAQDVHIGLRVRVAFAEIDGDFKVPVFVRAEGGRP